MTAGEELLRSDPDEFHLGCLLLSPTGTVYLTDTLATVDPEDFYDPVLVGIWGYARVLHSAGSRITRRALVAAAENDPTKAVRPSLVNVWLEKVAGEPMYPQRLPQSIRAVKETAKLRRLVQATEMMRHRALLAPDYAQALEWARDALQNLVEGDAPPEVVPFADLVDEWRKQMAGGLVVGEVVPTPWLELNEVLGGGLHPGRSYVIAARPGLGKTTSGLNIAAGAAEQGLSTLVVSQEMTRFEITGKMMAAGGHAEYSEIVRYEMSDDTASRVTEYGDTNRDMPLRVIDTPGMTVENVFAVAKSVKTSSGLDLVFVDYLQLIESSDRKLPREQQVAHTSRMLKRLPQALECSTLIAAQLNRSNAKDNRRPVLTDLRESGAVEQNSDVVILLHHETTTDNLPTGTVLLIVAKNRFGPSNVEIELPWRGYQSRIG
jgi:replicative DNA helicase